MHSIVICNLMYAAYRSPSLHQKVETLKRENDDLQGKFLQHGRELLSQKNQSLAAEIEHASKEEVINGNDYSKDVNWKGVSENEIQ